MVTFPLRPVDIHGIFFCTPFRQCFSHLNLLTSSYQGWERGCIASGKAGKPNKSSEHSMPFTPENFSLDRLLKFSWMTLKLKPTRVLLVVLMAVMRAFNKLNGVCIAKDQSSSVPHVDISKHSQSDESWSRRN